MQKISPFLWFNEEAQAAAKFCVSVFKKGSKILKIARYGAAGPGPKGSVMTVAFRLAGMELTALNGGPHFKFTPAISLVVSCAATGILLNISRPRLPLSAAPAGAAMARSESVAEESWA